MRKCVLVNCFASSNEMRIEPIRDVLDSNGFETVYISSDFHHTLKKYVELDKSIVPIRVRAYKKNISVDRLLSHRDFSKEVFRYLCKEQPELLYIKFPPNSLVKTAYEYKKNHKCKIILDLFDLWPESLPVNESIKRMLYPFMRMWARYRDKYISCADLVMTECDMYRDVLGDVLPSNTKTLYLTKQDIRYKFQPAKYKNVNLCFLGGINNLIDIESIGKVIRQFCEQGMVSLDIIGDGQYKDSLISIAKINGANTRFHGILYDEEVKYRIMSNCDFGLNLIKSSTKIALSLKSIEYFRAGLGVINNTQYDTKRIIEKEFAGVNYTGNEHIDINQTNHMKQNARKVYLELFSIPVIKSTFEKYLNLIMEK